MISFSVIGFVVYLSFQKNNAEENFAIEKYQPSPRNTLANSVSPIKFLSAELKL